MSHKYKISAVFFDLDGTLLDTAQDLLEALNSLLVKYNYDQVTLSELIPYISSGSANIIKNLLKLDLHPSELLKLREEFIHAYNAMGHKHTKLFPDMQEVLTFLNTYNIPWGIITNKLTSITLPVVQLFELDKLQCQTVVCADTTDHEKPHPAPMLKACADLNVEPNNCIFIGDALTDIQAGKAVNMKTIVAAYGYLPLNANVLTWGADGVIYSPKELLPLF